MTHHAFTDLPPDARARLHRLLRLGAKTPYVRERIEEEFGHPMPDYPAAYRGYAAENGLPWRGIFGMRYPVTSILDPERPWRDLFRAMVQRREPYLAILRALRDAGAPLTPDSDAAIRSAIAASGWAYQPHTKGGSWGRTKRTYGKCPSCGQSILKPRNTYCSRQCYLDQPQKSVKRRRKEVAP